MKTSRALVGALASLLLITACNNEGSTPTPVESPATTTPPASTTTTATTAVTTTTIPEVPVTMWIEEGMGSVFEGYAADFQAATGIPVAIEEYPEGQAAVAAAEALAAGAGPDVFFGSHVWTESLVAAGLLSPITVPYPESYLPEALSAFTVGAEVYGVPATAETAGLYVNLELLPEGLGNSTDLQGRCADLPPEVQCFGLPHDDPAVALAIVNAFGGYGFGRTETGTDPTDVGLDGDGASAAADYLDGQSLLGSMTTSAEVEQLFAEGRVAIRVGGPETEPGPKTWTAARYTPAGAAGPAAAVEVKGFMISIGSERPQAAAALVTEFLATDGASFDHFVAAFVAPARVVPLADAVVTDPTIAAFSPDGSGTAALLPSEPHLTVLYAGLSEAMETIAAQDYTETGGARAVLSGLAQALRSGG